MQKDHDNAEHGGEHEENVRTDNVRRDLSDEFENERLAVVAREAGPPSTNKGTLLYLWMGVVSS
jgi:hypothetical protein